MGGRCGSSGRAPGPTQRPTGRNRPDHAAAAWQGEPVADIAVHRSDDPAVAYAAAESFLLTEPGRHNIVLSLLHERMAHPEPGRYWWVSDEQRVVGVAMQSPLTFTWTITPMPVHAIGP